MKVYKILQKTKLPAGYENIPVWQLQAAEYDLRINERYYHETCINVDGVFCYPLEIARRIVDYWRARWVFAEYKLEATEASA